MFRNYEIDFLPKHKIDFLVNETSNLKYKVAILLMADGGLRVSEAITLKLGNFDFKERIMCVESLKKREKARFKTRLIPIKVGDQAV